MFPRLLKYATKNILRNSFLSISSVLILTLLIFFINILIVLHDVSLRLIEWVNEKLTISLYLNEEYNKNSVEIIDLQSDIKESLPNVGITYKTKDEVLEEIRERDPDLVKILERQNPLPETITLENIGLQQYKVLNQLVENKLYVLAEGQKDLEVSNFSSYTRQFERIEKVTSILTTLQIGLYIIIATFIVSIAVIVYSIIGNFIYYYRDEIYITRLVGGSKVFIYGPFSLQGMMYVMFAFILATILFLLLLQNMQYIFDLTDRREVYTGDLTQVLLLEAAVFLLVGWVSGFLSSRRYITAKK